MRRIRFEREITPATATTCGGGGGKFCPLMSYNSLTGVTVCWLFGSLIDLDGLVQRADECKAAEVKEST